MTDIEKMQTVEMPLARMKTALLLFERGITTLDDMTAALQTCAAQLKAAGVTRLEPA